MKRVTLLLGSLVLGLAALLPAATSGTPASAISYIRIHETNGIYSVGWTSSGNGDAVREISGGYRLHFNPTTTYRGLAAGTMQFTNGQFMAATADCAGVIQKSSSSDNGTVWAEYFPGDGTVRIISRPCDTQAGSPLTMALAGRNNGTNFSLCGGGLDCSGWFRSMTLSS